MRLAGGKPLELPDGVDVEDLLLDNFLRRGSVRGLCVRAGDHTNSSCSSLGLDLYDFLEYPEPRAGAFTVSCHADRLADVSGFLAETSRQGAAGC